MALSSESAPADFGIVTGISFIVFVLFQSASTEYFQSTMNLILSSLLEQNNIKTNFIEKYSNIRTGSKPDDLKNIVSKNFLNEYEN